MTFSLHGVSRRFEGRAGRWRRWTESLSRWPPASSWWCSARPARARPRSSACSTPHSCLPRVPFCSRVAMSRRSPAVGCARFAGASERCSSSRGSSPHSPRGRTRSSAGWGTGPSQTRCLHGYGPRPGTWRGWTRRWRRWASSTGPAHGATSCRAASSSGWPSHGCSCRSPPRCSPTSRSRHSTRRCARAWASCSWAWLRGAVPWSL